MAIYHLSYKTGTRAGGQSAGAKYAYLTRTEQYEGGSEQVAYVEHAHYPSYVSDPADFWKAADAYERANGSLFVEVEVALPKELDEQQRLELAREYAEWLSYKMPTRETDALADGPLPYTIALHKGHEGGNPHAHIMLNERPTDGVERTLETTFKRANREHPELGGAAKSVAFKHTNTVNEVRQEWELKANAALERAGHEARIDHRSYAEQGVEREPGVHMGHRATAMERRGEQTERGDEQRAIQERNREREQAAELARERAEFDARVERMKERLVREGYEESTKMNGRVESTLEKGGKQATLVMNHEQKKYALVFDEQPQKVSLAQVKNEFVLERQPMAFSELKTGDEASVRPRGEEVSLYVGLVSAGHLKAQKEKERAEQEEQAREREREKEREKEREQQRQQEERARQNAQAIKQEVEAQNKAYREAGWVQQQHMVTGKVASVREVGDARVVVVASEYSKSYAVMVNAEERSASVKVNDKDKAELVMERAATPLKRGDSAYADIQGRFICRDYTEASYEKQRIQRAMDRDNGWDR